MLTMRCCTRSISRSFIASSPAATLFSCRSLFTDGKRILGNDNQLKTENMFVEMENKKSKVPEEGGHVVPEDSVFAAFTNSFWGSGKKDTVESMLPSLDQLMKEIPSSQEIHNAIQNKESADEFLLNYSKDDEDD